jgi:hypothetical protein
MLTQSDNDLVVYLAGGGGACSLDSSPGSNWVEKAGGLPNYICNIAKSVMKTGKSKSSAIAIAVSRVKKWAAGGDDVEADTRAKAAAALAQWEKMKAKTKAGKVVKASREDGSEYLMLAADNSWNVDSVRTAWQAQQTAARQAARASAVAAGLDPYSEDVPSHPYSYIREMWTDHLIIEIDGSRGQKLASVPFTVTDGTPAFGEPKPVEMQYVEVADAKGQFSDNEKALLSDVLSSPTIGNGNHLTDLMELAARLRG